MGGKQTVSAKLIQFNFIIFYIYIFLALLGKFRKFERNSMGLARLVGF